MKENLFNSKKMNVFIHSIVLYLILFIIKDFIFSFLSINYNNVNLIITIQYQILIIAISLIYYIKNSKKDNYKDTFISLLIGFLTITTYFLFSFIKSDIFSLLGFNNNSPQIIKSIFLIIYSLLIIFLLILINKKTLKKDIIDIKKNHKIYFSKYIKYWFLALLIMMFSNLIISFINNGNIAQNEATIRSTFKISPIYTLFSGIIFAPIAEELVFRRSLKNMISSPLAFIITSGIIFGGLHVIGSINSWVDFLYLIPYSVHGLVFAYILTETDNVLVPMGIHFMHNGIMLSLQVLLFLLGVL